MVIGTYRLQQVSSSHLHIIVRRHHICMSIRAARRKRLVLLRSQRAFWTAEASTFSTHISYAEGWRITYLSRLLIHQAFPSPLEDKGAPNIETTSHLGSIQDGSSSLIRARKPKRIRPQKRGSNQTMLPDGSYCVSLHYETS